MASFVGIILVAGIVGTLIGAMVGLSIHRRSTKLLGLFLSVSSGMLLSIIGFDLIPEALEHGSVVLTGSFVVAGIVIIAIISYLLGHHHSHDSHSHHDHHNHDEDSHAHNHVIPQVEICEDCGEELIPFNDGHFHVYDGDLRKTGLVMLLAVSLHNIPSGLAIGTGYAHNHGVGITLAVLIALHNLPEGMAMILPLVGSGMKQGKALFLIALTGIPTIVGGLIGYSLASVSETLISILLSLAAGAMLYVTIMEIIPQAKAMYGKKTFPLLAILGVMIGYLLIFFTHAEH